MRLRGDTRAEGPVRLTVLKRKISTEEMRKGISEGNEHVNTVAEAKPSSAEGGVHVILILFIKVLLKDRIIKRKAVQIITQRGHYKGKQGSEGA